MHFLSGIFVLVFSILVESSLLKTLYLTNRKMLHLLQIVRYRFEYEYSFVVVCYPRNNHHHHHHHHHYSYKNISVRIFQKVIDSYKHGVVSTPPSCPPPPPQNYVVSSSYKTPNCLNIRNNFDISDNRHLRV